MKFPLLSFLVIVVAAFSAVLVACAPFQSTEVLSKRLALGGGYDDSKPPCVA